MGKELTKQKLTRIQLYPQRPHPQVPCPDTFLLNKADNYLYFFRETGVKK